MEMYQRIMLESKVDNLTVKNKFLFYSEIGSILRLYIPV